MATVHDFRLLDLFTRRKPRSVEQVLASVDDPFLLFDPEPVDPTAGPSRNDADASVTLVPTRLIERSARPGTSSR